MQNQLRAPSESLHEKITIYIMALNYISAAEAASPIKHGYNIGLSGFTPAGTAKAVTAELAKIAEAEHAKRKPVPDRYLHRCFYRRLLRRCALARQGHPLPRALHHQLRLPQSREQWRNSLQRHPSLTDGAGSTLWFHGKSKRCHHRGMRGYSRR